jgi:hypothetical protein
MIFVKFEWEITKFRMTHLMASLEERIAALALRTFDNLPPKSKPRIHPDGSREWVPMSAIVLVQGIYGNSASIQKGGPTDST